MPLSADLRSQAALQVSHQLRQDSFKWTTCLCALPLLCDVPATASRATTAAASLPCSCPDFERMTLCHCRHQDRSVLQLVARVSLGRTSWPSFSAALSLWGAHGRPPCLCSHDDDQTTTSALGRRKVTGEPSRLVEECTRPNAAGTCLEAFWDLRRSSPCRNRLNA